MQLNRKTKNTLATENKSASKSWRSRWFKSYSLAKGTRAELKITNEKKNHTNECTKIKLLSNGTQKKRKPSMKPYTLLAKPQEEIKYLRTMKLFKIYYKYTNERRHDTRHGRGTHSTHTHKQEKVSPSGGTQKERKKETSKLKPAHPRLQGAIPPAHSSLGGSPEKYTKKVTIKVYFTKSREFFQNTRQERRTCRKYLGARTTKPRCALKTRKRSSVQCWC